MNRIASLQGLRMCFFIIIFLFHTSAFAGMNETPVYRLFEGGGTLAVSFFFVLSGFGVALGWEHGFILNPRNILTKLYRQFKRIYPYHFFWLLMILPLFLRSLIAMPLQRAPLLAIHIFLLQSWFPNREVWLGYNGIAWFLSTIFFLYIGVAPLRWLAERLEVKPGFKKYYYLYGMALCCLSHFILALVVRENVSYWLYAFPPVRLLDFAAAFWCGRYFIISAKRDVGFTTANEVIAVVICMVYLTVFSFVPLALRRSAIYLPGMLFVVWKFARGGVNCRTV